MPNPGKKMEQMNEKRMGRAEIKRESMEKIKKAKMERGGGEEREEKMEREWNDNERENIESIKWGIEREWRRK